ncbi:ParE family toxin-like protein [Acidithiobacillus caldus]
MDLRVLPHASLRKQAEAAILGVVRDGMPYTAFSGKRMGYDRRIISVPIGRGWRLLLKEREDKSKVVVSLLSHESYNRARPR